MQRVDLRILVDETRLGGERFQVFGDGATGTMDWNTAFNAEPFPLHPGRSWHRGHLEQPHLTGGHLRTASLGVHLTQRHLVDPHLVMPLIVLFRTGLLYFGKHQLAVRVQDHGGNISGTDPAPQPITINTGPDAPFDFQKTSYDGQTDQVTFSLVPPIQLE